MNTVLCGGLCESGSESIRDSERGRDNEGESESKHEREREGASGCES